MDDIKLVPVDAPKKDGNVVYAILAKPKKPQSWWMRHSLELLIIGYCLVMIFVLTSLA